MVNSDSDSLLGELGFFAMEQSAAIHGPIVPSHPRRATLKEWGEQALYVYLRPIICDAVNKKIIDDTIKVANVLAFADVVLPHIPLLTGSHSPNEIPAPIVGAAVLVLRIGLNEYCKGRRLDETSSVPKPAGAQRQRKRFTPSARAEGKQE
jgi:hypothetical protein